MYRQHTMKIADMKTHMRSTLVAPCEDEFLGFQKSKDPYFYGII